MTLSRSIFSPVLIGVFYTLVIAVPVMTSPSVLADGSDEAFNREIGTMLGRDTGSMWVDYYVEVLNQEIASKDSVEPYGAAGAEGPVTGFDAYLGQFMAPDTGSTWMNEYVDNLNQFIQEHQQ